MYGRTKLTKRQIKEDKFTIFMLKAKNQVLDNWQYLVVGLVVVILAVTGTVYYLNSRQAQKQEAASRFARALMDYRAGNNQVAIMGLNQVVEEYGGDEVTEYAVFLLGNINYEIRNYPEAIRYFELYLLKYRQSRFNRAASLAGIASSLENQGQYREAAEKFVAAYNEYPNGPMIGDYQVSAMRNFLEVGEVDQAKTYLELITNEFDDTDLADRAVRLFSEKSRS